MELGESGFLTSDYTTQLPKWYGTGTKTNKQTNKKPPRNTVNRAGQKPKDKLTNLCHPIYDKGGKNIQWKIISSINQSWENQTATCKIMKLEHSLTPYSKIK